MTERVMPMFPLGTVLLPHGFLPLRVFEPRYRELTRDCLAADREFGVVLISRGSEVGGGDVRTDLGAVARIVEATELPDGQWVLGTVGVRRIAVRRWLDDAPYPRAEVEDLEDEPAGPGAAARRDDVTRVLRRVLGLRAELGEPGPPATVELDGDPAVAAYQAAVLSPLTPLDAQRVLAAPGADARLELLATLLAEESEVLEMRLR